MNTWRESLAKFVTIAGKATEPRLFPLSYYKVLPADPAPWPSELPSSVSIRDFYSLCDGGTIEGFHFERKCDLVGKNSWWRENFVGYYPNGSSPLKPCHLYLAWDDAAAPLFWDSESDLMASFWFKGGDWEPYNKTFDEFMEWLFVKYERQTELDHWYRALEQLRQA